MKKQQLTIALSKGRILEETLPLLEAADIVPVENIFKSRKLIFDTNHDNIKFVVIRATDVPTYVEYGGADMGIAGKDVLMEHGGAGLYEPLDLEISKCKLMVAGMKGAEAVEGRMRIATKFVNVARQYFAKQGRQVDIVKLYGAMELAPIMGLADRIVDIVDTGNTLRANGLEPMDHIADISSRLVVGQPAMKMKHRQIQPILDMMEQAVKARRDQE